MRIIEAREERIQVGENDVLVYDHKSAIDESRHVLQVLVGGSTEMCMVAPTRGEALSDLGDFLVDLGRALKKLALEQEGCTGLTVGQLSKP